MQKNTKTLARLLKFKIGTKVVIRLLSQVYHFSLLICCPYSSLALNIDKLNCLINGRRRYIRQIEFSYGCIFREYEEFTSQQAHLEARASSYLGRASSLVPIKC